MKKLQDSEKICEMINRKYGDPNSFRFISKNYKKNKLIDQFVIINDQLLK